MKRKPTKKAVTLALTALLATGVLTATALYFSEPESSSLVVSAGLQQFADNAYLACSAPAGQSVCFTPEWFDNTLQGGSVSAITVTSLPPATQGVLKLGYGNVTQGQVIPRETLSYLTFVPNEGVRESSFCFMPSTVDGGVGYTLSCRLSLTDSVNCCPAGTKSVTAVSTHSSITLTGKLSASDPDGDALCYEVLSYPQNGTLTLDAVSGAFSYCPASGFAGSDSFTWRAQDAAGGFSEAATVEIGVRELSTGYLFSDIEGGNAQSAAQRVSESGLMSGEMLGGKHYFHPDRALTRAAFVTVLLEAAEVQYPHVEKTDFEDDGEIPPPMKAAVAYAKEQGWLGTDTTFRPNDAITRAEAARIAAAVLGLGTPGYSETVEDFEAIPVDVADALYAIYEGGYITTMADGTLSPAGTLTRGDAARFFARILDGKESAGN